MNENSEIGPAGDAALPIRAVTLFSSGVSYTLREGEIDGGEASVTLTFRTSQVNDILKSLVLLDEAGTVQAATYPSRDPIGRSLQSFAVDVTGNPSRADLLRQLRGAAVLAQTTGGESLSGRVVGVEERAEVVGEREIIVQTLTLLGDEGMLAVPLDKVRLLRLLDARLDREFRDALAVLASGSDDDRRAVTLKFAGRERRPVRVGYISEAPLWKVSYRLVLDEEGSEAAAKPYLQGWALVENTTDEDWTDISLSLVSGRPISFVQDLYQPLYVPRPVVPPDVIASPYPQTHGRDLQEALADAPIAYQAEEEARFALAAAPAPRGVANLKILRQSVTPQAQGQGIGELFEYHITAPVSLPRQQAAMIPIVAEDADGEKLSLYNADSDPRFPLNAFRLKNNTSLHLKGGPVTVFDAGVYAGDARMEDIPPGDGRLLTYAVDLAIECERQASPGVMSQATLSIKRGVLHLKRRRQQETTYTLKSKAKKARQVLVEHPFLADWELVTPETPAERTADRYRFTVSLSPGETKTLRVVVEQPVDETVALLDGGLNAIASYVSAGYVSARFKEALAPVVERRRRIIALEEAAGERHQQRQGITAEQERIRENMAALDRDSALYRRYVDELDQQETRLKELRAEEEQLRTEAQALGDELRAYLDTLEVE